MSFGGILIVLNFVSSGVVGYTTSAMAPNVYKLWGLFNLQNLKLIQALEVVKKADYNINANDEDAKKLADLAEVNDAVKVVTDELYEQAQTASIPFAISTTITAGFTIFGDPSAFEIVLLNAIPFVLGFAVNEAINLYSLGYKGLEDLYKHELLTEMNEPADISDTLIAPANVEVSADGHLV